MIRFIREKLRLLKYRVFFFAKEKELPNSYISSLTVDDQLTKLMDYYGSDKGGKSNHHNYTNYYSELFFHRKNEIKNFLEVGLGTNNQKFSSNMGPEGSPLASVRAWRDYFVNANIYGADIDKSILKNENRIKTFYVDQTNSQSINELFLNIGNVKFDIIIDDGLHEYYANICFFENSIKYLSDDGLYIIEDVHYKYKDKFFEYFKNKNYSFSFINLYHKKNIKDNSLIVIKKNKF